MTLEVNDRAQHSATEARTLSSLDITPPPTKAGETRVAQLGAPPNVTSDVGPALAGTTAGVAAGSRAGTDLSSSAVPCENPNSALRGMDNNALQNEVNALMLKDGYIFKDPAKSAIAAKMLSDRGITPLAPNPNFDSDNNLSKQDKELLSSLQAAKSFNNNYPGKDACTAITDPTFRQHGKSELLPDSMNKDLTADDIKKMGTDGMVSNDQIFAARNEIYMRAGRPFVSSDLAKFANEQGYKPRLNFKESDMTQMETGNAKLLLGVEGYMRENKLQKIDSATLDSVVAKLKGN